MFSTGGWLTLGYFLLLMIFIKISPSVVGALVLGIYLSVIIDVPAKFLNKWLKPKTSKIIANLSVFGLVLYAFTSFFPIIIEQGKSIFDQLSKIQVDNTTKLEIPDWIFNYINEINKWFTTFATKILNTIVTSVPAVITAILVVIITSAIIGGLKSKIRGNVWKLYKKDDRKNGEEFIFNYYKDFKKFVKGQFLIAMFVGAVVGLGCFIFRIPGGIFLGVLSFVTNFIPYLGVIIAATPLIMLGYTSNGLWGILFAVIILLVANQLEIWVISPRIQSNNLNIHWFVILISLLIFGQLLGIMGVLIAIPAVLFIKRFWKFYFIDNN